MPRIFDNIEQRLVNALKETLARSHRADFCVGYFNLRGWKAVSESIDSWTGAEDNRCRVLVGMHQPPDEAFRAAMRLSEPRPIDQAQVVRMKRQMAQAFREQLTLGAPTDADEAGLRQLARQLRARQLQVKLFLRHPLHAKLYLCYRDDPNSPIVGFLGSSNLTFAGLSEQGELNIDVLDHDACHKLSRWFEDRWNDRWCLDITDELAQIIEESWARETLIPPYHIYLKIAYHLSAEARAGLNEFRIPRDFKGKLFDFQEAAVRIAARYLHKRRGVLLGDVVGLGKTLMATALARIFEDDFGFETLILCPKNLVPMWEEYRQRFRMRATVLSLSRALQELPTLPRYRIVIIDESHNLRNPEGKRYRVIRDYLERNESWCILLSATPYNKTYLDLAAQLRLFVPDTLDLGVRPEQYLRRQCNGSEAQFRKLHDCPVRSLAAFEKSQYPDDWRELMRMFLVRRTRSFIQQHYAHTDPQTGRKYLQFPDGARSYFPERRPQTVPFEIDSQYARLYAPEVVQIINDLHLPRYGLGNYLLPDAPADPQEQKIIQDLSRAGKRLMGFCRTNLFKRLESSGYAFLQSVERHILRNYLFLHALENRLPLPIGPQGAEMLDTRLYDEDPDAPSVLDDAFDAETDDSPAPVSAALRLRTPAEFQQRAAALYNDYQQHYASRFRWLRPERFDQTLTQHLREDAHALLQVLNLAGEWNPDADAKLRALHRLLTKTHPHEKVLIFTQFADTVRYIEQQLQRLGVQQLQGVTGDSDDPTRIAWRFSPRSNGKSIPPEQELRVVIATDVLSEGQNLQDCSIVVNYDLPWAIIRLIQRAGRVDRIGQESPVIRVYSFLPADGVEQLIRLRERVLQRLRENAEVVGADEAFFETEPHTQRILDLYHEKTGVLDDEDDTEVDLASYAYQIWKNATAQNPKLREAIERLPNVVYATRPARAGEPEAVLVYLRTGDETDALALLDTHGNSLTESPYEILQSAACTPDTPALPRLPQHHQLVQQGVQQILQQAQDAGVQLGRRTGVRYRVYERLKAYAESVRHTVFDHPELHAALEELGKYPLQETTQSVLRTHLTSGVADETLAELVMNLRAEGRLCVIHDDAHAREPRILCSMGVRHPQEANQP